ncbi:tumor necrosis factor receptor superfamily member 6B-like [Poeciliopsis prolifica]|uniref:tumor necrosis factor receptor superfamily member 6B-like n=1 Tax=Poeciliopsis prolifica TaxID=188132 RepID=UPI0024131FE7|nr:tumor necrosis factor receptor superfamily member 6B-like [Poeciliopsis prolifica]
MSVLSQLVMLLLPGIIFCTEQDPTYEHRDRVTGEILLCNKCEPGTYRTAHCTATRQTQCRQCQSDHFTELPNYLSRCLYCNNFCSQNQEVEIECSPVSNRVCRCKAGFYMMEDFCIRHTECGSGYGVQAIGTPTKDTVCEKCPKGFFSSSSSALDQCVKHKDCLGEQVMILQGSAFHDTVCGTCQSLANGGEDLRAVLSASFTGSRIPRRDLKRLIHKVIHKNQEDDSALPKQRGPLVDMIRAWLAQASAEQLKELVKTMRDPQFSSIGTRLESILDEIKQQNPTCSL